ncbi:MAG TPA: IPT/TIG domain-containing protein, partial [Chryseolinea sp.]
MAKLFLPRLFATCLAVAFVVFNIVSCGEDEPEPPQVPSISSFSPAVGLPGTVVTISGKNFDATASNNTVKFSSIAATVSEATTTSLKVTVPVEAVTGKIEVITNDMSAISASDFVVPPVITDFTPKSGVAGSNVTITGKGFSSTAANNIVAFNGVTATVSAASATSLTVQVPTAGYSGTISVKIGSASVTTTETFKYHPVITAFDPTSGPIDAEITITGSGFNSDPESNLVKIGNVAATVVSSMANELVIKVAEGTETGLITVS